jgi:ribosomal protein L21E
MTKQIATATIEGTRKRGRPHKRWKGEVEEDLNIMGIKNGRVVARGRKWRKIVLQAKVHNGL